MPRYHNKEAMAWYIIFSEIPRWFLKNSVFNIYTEGIDLCFFPDIENTSVNANLLNLGEAL